MLILNQNLEWVFTEEGLKKLIIFSTVRTYTKLDFRRRKQWKIN